MTTALQDLYEAKRRALYEEQKELEGRILDLKENQARLYRNYLKARKSLWKARKESGV
jgi:hypothetical protein